VTSRTGSQIGRSLIPNLELVAAELPDQIVNLFRRRIGFLRRLLALSVIPERKERHLTQKDKVDRDKADQFLAHDRRPPAHINRIELTQQVSIPLANGWPGVSRHLADKLLDCRDRSRLGLLIPKGKQARTS
jgi:hypothetical protein